MNTDSYNELRESLLENDLAGDPWGTVMSAWFDISAELWWRDAQVPDHWQYSPGALGDPRDPDSLFAEFLPSVETEDLIKFGNVLERYSRLLRAAGKDY